VKIVDVNLLLDALDETSPVVDGWLDQPVVQGRATRAPAAVDPARAAHHGRHRGNLVPDAHLAALTVEHDADPCR
jgi:predicted nucleic acid-binding protein